MNIETDTSPFTSASTNTTGARVTSPLRRQGGKYLLLGAALTTSIALGTSAIPSLTLPASTSAWSGVVTPLVAPEGLTSGQLLRRLRDATNLTWDQLAKAFGVSRRSVHHWLSGEKLSAHNLELLARFDRLVTAFKGNSPDETRLALVRTDESGVSALDAFRRRSAVSGQIVSPRTGKPSDLLNAE